MRRAHLVAIALALACAGWNANNPSGDIQPFGSSAGGSTDPNAVHLAGTETITGAKTFSVAPVVPSASFPESAVTNLTTDLAAKATDALTCHLAGAETITGVKTFSATTFAANGNVTIGAAGGTHAINTTVVPTTALTLKGIGTSGSTITLNLLNNSNTQIFWIGDNGAVNSTNQIGTSTSGSAVSPALNIGNNNAGISNNASTRGTLMFSTMGVSAGTIDASQNWSLAGKVTAPNLDFSHLGAYDTQAQSAAYYTEDFFGTYNTNTLSVANTGSGYGFSATNGSDLNHPGAIQFYTGNGTGLGTIRISPQVLNSIQGVLKTSAQVISFNEIFRTPATLSTATDRYVLAVGAISSDSVSVTSPLTIGGGAGLRYSDNVNAGKWQCVTQASGGATENTADSGITVAANTWYNSTIVVTGAVVKFYIAGSLVCTITDSTVNAAGSFDFTAWSAYMDRTVSSGASPAWITQLDRASVYMSGLTR